ncbi:MAG: maleylacetoacetate isomerase [Alphaproteobacteria bacterium]|nr:maleylacetoacetate isomerase [Alphaproteobacteria bacterium]
MKLYGYFRSSAAFRVRIGLALKGIEAERVPVDLVGNQHFAAAFTAVNPQARVPALEVEGRVLVQSLAILEWLDETHPNPPFLPADPFARARVRGLADVIACDIHPLNNLAVLRYLADPLGHDEDAERVWYQHWIALGFRALEAMLAGSRDTGRFCHGDAPGLADICLVPQVFKARRYKCDLAPYPTLMRVFEACMAVPAFDRAQPDKQPEAAAR